MRTYMFPGQGSQKQGMGAELFDKYPELVAKADQVLGYSIKELCLDDPDGKLAQTQFTQPALYVVNALSYYDKVETDGVKPDFVAGHSLGEFNALLAAECFSFEVGLQLVKKRGELMSQVSGGGMAAIVNASEQQIVQILEDAKLDQIDLANFNTDAQIVISGPKEQIEQAEPLFAKDKMKFRLLQTSGAFHSRHMEPSRQQFAQYLAEFELLTPKIPVISNVTAREHTLTELQDLLAAQISSSVRWLESVEYLMDKTDNDSMEFEELGHGKVLAGILRKIKRARK